MAAAAAAVAVGAGALLVAFLVAGSGPAEQCAAQRSTGPDARRAVRQVADVLAEAGTFRTRTAMETASGGTRLTVRGRGAFDYARGVGRITLRLPTGASGAAVGRPITELITPGALFMKNRGAGVPADKWVRVDTAEVADGNLVSGGATDPISAAELLRGVQEARYLGRRMFDGVMVRHYRGTTDIGEAARAASPRSRPRLLAAARGFSRVTVPFDVLLDGRGRLRQVRHEFTVAAGGGGGAGWRGPSELGVSSTTTVYGFGAPVAVELPEPAEIFTGTVAASGTWAPATPSADPAAPGALATPTTPGPSEESETSTVPGASGARGPRGNA